MCWSKFTRPRETQITYGFGFEVVNRGGSVPSGTVALPNLPPVGLPSNFTVSETTYYGPRGTFQYTRNNVRGKGRIAFRYRVRRDAWISVVAALLHRSQFPLVEMGIDNVGILAEEDEENPIYSSQVENGSYQLQTISG